jgi:hypothetical protein
MKDVVLATLLKSIVKIELLRKSHALILYRSHVATLLKDNCLMIKYLSYETSIKKHDI